MGGLLCAKVASMIKGRTVEELREQFKIKDPASISEEVAQLSVNSSPSPAPSDTHPHRQEARPKAQVFLDEAAKDIERIIDIPEGFKTMDIPSSYRSFVINLAKWQNSFIAPLTANHRA